MPTTYYLKLGAGDEQVLGDSRDAHHRGWIKLESLQYSSPRSSEQSPGKTGASSISLVKPVDRASSAVQRADQDGKMFKSAILEVADSKTGAPKLRITLSDVMVSSFTPSHGARDAIPREEVTLTFQGIKFNESPPPEDSIWDVVDKTLRLLGIGRTPAASAAPQSSR